MMPLILTRRRFLTGAPSVIVAASLVSTLALPPLVEPEPLSQTGGIIKVGNAEWTAVSCGPLSTVPIKKASGYLLRRAEYIAWTLCLEQPTAIVDSPYDSVRIPHGLSTAELWVKGTSDDTILDAMKARREFEVSCVINESMVVKGNFLCQRIAWSDGPRSMEVYEP